MQLDEIRALRWQLEERLCSFIAKAFSDFEEKAVVSPEGLSVRMVHHETLNSREARCIVQGVHVELPRI